jgi:hypothetical protein
MDPHGDALGEPDPFEGRIGIDELPMYCITLRNKFDDTVVGWYDQSASHFSTDQRRAKVFRDRDDADLVANQLRRRYAHVAKYIDVSTIEPTAIVYIFDRNRAVAL